MAHVPRCLVPDLRADEHSLDARTRHHVERVLRLREGDEALLVDGRGGLARARLLSAGRVRVQSRAAPSPPDPRAPVLAVAVPRLPRLEWLVEKACELGVARLALLETQHGERELGPARLARLARLCDEALLLCGRLHRMPVEAPAPLADVLASADGAELWLSAPPAARGPPGDERAGSAADAAGEGPSAGAGLPVRAAGRALLALVGPEGGFSAAEQELVLARGARRVSLGATVLRVETAALAMAVLAAAAERSLR
jgi:16S rRNA (uracil1498-N3)-methyltransferase